MGAAEQYNVHDAKTHFSKLLELVATGGEVIISRAGEPVAKIVPLEGRIRRTDYGSLRGTIEIADDFDDLPEGFDDAFGVGA